LKLKIAKIKKHLLIEDAFKDESENEETVLYVLLDL
jgi:hypothetical protein